MIYDSRSRVTVDASGVLLMGDLAVLLENACSVFVSSCALVARCSGSRWLLYACSVYIGTLCCFLTRRVACSVLVCCPVVVAHAARRLIPLL